MADAPTSQPAPSGWRGGRVWLLALVIGLAIVVAGVLIYQAWMAITAMGSNSFSTGEIEIANDGEATAVLNLTDLAPGDSGTDDIVVNCTGAVDSEVRLLASGSGAAQDLAAYLRLTITAMGAVGSPWTGTLADFQESTTFAGGILPVTLAPDATQTYTVAFEVLDDAPVGSSADVTFVWKAE